MNTNLRQEVSTLVGPAHLLLLCRAHADQAALNGLTLAMAIELEAEGIKVNAVSPGYTKTRLTGFAGTESVEEGAAEAVRVALLGPDAPTGTFTHATMGIVPW